MSGVLRLGFVVSLFLGACGLSPAFGGKAEAAKMAVRDTRGIAGPWVGQWESKGNGHKGSLRCLVEPVGDSRYLFRYRAGWGKLFSGNFPITCEVTPAGNGVYAVKGTKSLLLFGTYHHDGKISPRKFEATFRSGQKDLGSFSLRRPDGWKP